MEDLRIHLINRTLSGIAGGTVPPRGPLDPTVPRLRRSPSSGQLMIEPVEARPVEPTLANAIEEERPQP